MLKPDPDENPYGDAAWFGILTWIQPEAAVRMGKPRLVRSLERRYTSYLTHIYRARYGGCTSANTSLTSSMPETLTISRRQLSVSDFHLDFDTDTLPSLLDELRACQKKQAWVSDHYSDVPLDSMISKSGLRACICPRL